jgi:hypothetical protein
VHPFSKAVSSFIVFLSSFQVLLFDLPLIDDWLPPPLSVFILQDGVLATIWLSFSVLHP